MAFLVKTGTCAITNFCQIEIRSTNSNWHSLLQNCPLINNWRDLEFYTGKFICRKDGPSELNAVIQYPSSAKT